MAVKYSIPFKDFDDVPWRIDVADSISFSGDPVFNYTINQNALPLVQAGISIKDETEYKGGGTEAGSGSVTVMQHHSYEIAAIMGNIPANPNPRLRLTIYENGVLIFDKSVVATNTDASIIKTGTAIPGYIYDITVTGDYNASQVTPVDNESDPSGIPIPVRGNGQAGVLVWAPDTTDDPFSCYKSSTLNINCINEGQINVSELMEAQDRAFTVTVYKRGVMFWQGFLISDGIQYSYQAPPTQFTFTAICGLTMLADLPYVNTDLPGTAAQISRCPMNYFRNILFGVLGNVAPIRWTNLLTNSLFDAEDVFAGSVQWGADGQAFVSYQSGQNDDDAGPVQTCDYILQGMLRSMQCYICFDNGAWRIRRINDMARPLIPYKQIAGDLDVMVIQAGTENITSQIGRYGYRFINEDQIITVKQGIKSATVTYSANVRNNILPNGSQDLITDVPQPVYWSIYTDQSALATLSDEGSLDGRDGYCTDLFYTGTFGDPGEWFTMFTSADNPLGKRGLPVDTQTMIKYIIFGFQFEFTISGDTPIGGIIDWTASPFLIKVIFNAGGIQYFLNEHGFWVTTDTSIAITVDDPALLLTDVAQIDFNKFQNVIMPIPPAPVVAGFESNIQVMFRIIDGQQYKLDNIYINIAGGNDVYTSTFDSSKNTTVDKRNIDISSSFGGYMLSNFMTSPFNSGDECYFRDGAIYEGTLTGLTANAIMRLRYKSSRLFNGSINTSGYDWNFDKMYNIDGFAAAMFMPLGCSYNIEQCQVNNLVAIEIRNDYLIFTEQYYNSNDEQLSN